MTITLQAVNELIASLESAGELSIREQKFLKLAKEFRICSASLDAAIKTGNMLADQNAQLAAENVEAKKINSECREYFIAGVMNRIRPTNEGYLHMICDTFADETPATDRIVAGIKADEAKFIFQSILDNPAVTDLGSLVDWLEQHANDSAAAVRAMREGADK
ncbi:hypothetical protein AAFL38_28885 [Klebsiella grimontii]|uniref:Ead/Ea22-like family protein n=1 Tax=Klebsiella grimontii TaxID=2058152 RepID=A0ABU9PBP6_9ENTR|nr:hypothetical protein [Klebsiella michiganensis]MEC5775997.1 hypothetical protein [Klebsiella michiganensis]